MGIWTHYALYGISLRDAFWYFSWTYLKNCYSSIICGRGKVCHVSWCRMFTWFSLQNRHWQYCHLNVTLSVNSLGYSKLFHPKCFFFCFFCCFTWLLWLLKFWCNGSLLSTLVFQNCWYWLITSPWLIILSIYISSYASQLPYMLTSSKHTVTNVTCPTEVEAHCCEALKVSK